MGYLFYDAGAIDENCIDLFNVTTDMLAAPFIPCHDIIIKSIVSSIRRFISNNVCQIALGSLERKNIGTYQV